MSIRAARLLAVLVAFALASACGGGGGGGSSGGGGGGSVVDVTGVAPTTFPQAGASLVVTGTGFLSLGSAAQIEYRALVGTPFLRGTTETLQGTGTIESDTRLHVTTPNAQVLVDTLAFLIVTPPTGPQQFSLPLTFSPTTKITSPTEDFDDWHGASVAIDGDLAAVGVPQSDFDGAGSGSVVVYRRVAGVWDVEDEILAPDALGGDAFGASVALSGDRLVVGAPERDDFDESTGVAYVFRWTGLVWAFEQKLAAPDPTRHDDFGDGVCIDGDTIAIAAPSDSINRPTRASVHVFRRSGTTWSIEGRLASADLALGDLFATAVALSGDRVVVGARGEDERGSDAGAAYVFQRTGTAWSQVAKFLGSDSVALDNFGVSVALDGDVAVLGASGYDGPSASGAAYVVRRNASGVWLEEQILRSPAPFEDERFGRWVAIDGDVIALGVAEDGFGDGAAHLFTRTSGSWSARHRYAPGALLSASHTYGEAIALDGNDLLVTDLSLLTRGSTYFYDISAR